MKASLTSLVVVTALVINARGLDAQRAESTVGTVEVSGISTRYRIVGLDRRAPGSPLIVFQSGAGSPLEVWEAVIHGLGDTPALTYDRPGIAGSSYDGRSPTPQRVNEHLRALLDRLEMAPPYILVGHSWGGALILNYVDQFPEEVSGVVYVDPSILIPKVADTRGILRGLGASDPEITTYERQETEEFEKAIEALSQAPPGLRAEILAMDEYRRSQAADAPRSLPSLPSSVILAGRPEPGVGPGPGMLPQSISWPALFDANRAFNQAQFTERLSHIAGTSVLVSEDAGHAIHRDTPAIVVQEIRRVVALTLRR